MEDEAKQQGRSREEIVLGHHLRHVGKFVLYNDREDVVEARMRGAVALPMAAFVTGVAVSKDGQFDGLHLMVLHPELGFQIRRNVPPSPPSENGDEPGYFESLVKEPPQQVQFDQLQALVVGGIEAELTGLLSDMLPGMVRELVDEIHAKKGTDDDAADPKPAAPRKKKGAADVQ